MILLSFLFACDLLGPPDVSEQLNSAKSALQQGDITNAESAYRDALSIDSKNIDALIGQSYVLLLQKEFSKADSILTKAQVAAKETEQEEVIKEIFFRRALVALQEGAFDKVKVLGEKSDFPAGFLLVAEIQIIDGEYQDAQDNLNKVMQLGESAMQKLASDYLDDLSVDDRQMIAEAQARWALGDRKIAVKVVKKPLLNYISAMSEGASHDEAILWSSRALAVGNISTSEDLINAVRRTSKDQGWRVNAVKTLITCAKAGKSGVGLNACVEELSQLSGPEDGLIDAHVTAAQFVHEKSPKVAKEILSGIENDASAYVYYQMGDQSEAESIGSDVFRNLISR
jgi:tetratricopeptide (TPR) repeat protein